MEYKELAANDAADRLSVLRTLLINEPLQNQLGGETRYSDLGFMLLNQVVEHVAGVKLNLLVEKEIFGPAGVGELFFPGTARPLPS